MRCLVLLFLIALWPAAAAAQTLVVRPEVCAALTEHVPDPGAAYMPGLDAGGRAVAPADLPARDGAAFSEVAIQLTVDLRERLGIKLDKSLFSPGADLGYVTVSGGQAYLNGVPLAADAEPALASLCRGRGLRWPDPLR